MAHSRMSSIDKDPGFSRAAAIAEARALRADGATVCAIQAALETRYGRRLWLDALPRVLSDKSAPGKCQQQ
jgi:hypothetical protein